MITNLEKKTLFENFISLSTLQGINYVLPLITFPYLVRVLGIELFGLLAFIMAIITYFNIITDYGFNLSATKEVSIHKDEEAKLVEIFSSVMLIKIVLMIGSFLLLMAIVLSFEKLYLYWELYFIAFGIVIGQVLTPTWFFMGIEKMKYITYINILSKSIFTIAIFICVQIPEDIHLVVFFSSLGYIVAGFYSIYLIKVKYKIKFKMQKTTILKAYLVDGWHIFISRIYYNLYSTTNVIILGFFTNNVIVGYYSIAEKIVLAIGSLFGSANQAMYPFLVKKSKDLLILNKLVNKISFVFIISTIVLITIVEYYKEEIIYLVTGNYSMEILTLLSILIIRILFFPFGGLFSNLFIILDEKNRYMRVMNTTVIANFLIVPILIYSYKELGLAVGLIIVLLIHVIMLWYYVNSSFKDKY